MHGTSLDQISRLSINPPKVLKSSLTRSRLKNPFDFNFKSTSKKRVHFLDEIRYVQFDPVQTNSLDNKQILYVSTN